MNLLTYSYAAPVDSGTVRAPLLLLPGAKIPATDFAFHAFVEAVHRRCWPVDILAVETGLESYLDDIAARLHSEIIVPALMRGIASVWIAAISPGVFGASRDVNEFGDLIDRLLLLVSFIDSRGLIAKGEAAGGIGHWTLATRHEANSQHDLLKWLGVYVYDGHDRQTSYLGFGVEDRCVTAHRLLAATFPTANVWTTTGGHDWATWATLWESPLDSASLGASVSNGAFA